MYKNILVINLMQIGDLLLVTPVLRTLRKNYPKAKITLLADKGISDLFIANKHIDECILFDRRGEDRKLPNFVNFVKKIRRQKYDLVINLHRNERSSAFAALSGGKKIVGYSKPGFSLFFTKVMPNQKAVKHQIHSHFDVLTEAAGVKFIDDGGIEMFLTKEAKRSAAKLWKKNFAPGDKVAAFNIGASWETKRWLDSYFAYCADEIIKRGLKVAFLGSKDDIEIVNRCISQMKNFDEKKVVVFTGQVTLGELAGILSNCALMITTDSGPMHIGVAMNVPIVTMFGSSPVPGFYPYDAKDILIKTPVPCHPCRKHVCPKTGEENMLCMKKIPPEEVMKQADVLLEKFGGRPASKLPGHYGEYECQVIGL